MALVRYLDDANVKIKLIENIKSFLDADIVKANGVSYVSRVFNNMPSRYEQVQPVLLCLQEAINSGNMDAWIDVALMYGIEDMFTEAGEIRPDVYAALNHECKLDRLLAEYTDETIFEEIKAQLLSAHFGGLIAEHGFTEIIAKMPNTLNDLGAAPFALYSMCLNPRLAELHRVDQTFITSIKQKITSMQYDNNINVPLLKALLVSREAERAYKKSSNAVSAYFRYGWTYVSYHAATPLSYLDVGGYPSYAATKIVDVASSGLRSAVSYGLTFFKSSDVAATDDQTNKQLMLRGSLSK